MGDDLPISRCTVLAGLGTLGLPALTTRSASAADPVKIGVLSDLSGTLSDYRGPTCITAAQMAAEDFGGSVLGRPIQIVSADHQNKADIGAAIARKWFDVEGVSAIADLPNSSVALAVQHLASGERSRSSAGPPAGS